MPSIAQVVVDHYNGVTTPTPKPVKVVKAKPVQEPLTEVQVALKESTINALRVGVWTVEFIKADGTHSTMECTLDQRYIPQPAPGELKVASPDRSHVEHLVAVYAIDRAGWRSFDIRRFKTCYKKQEAL